MKSLGEQLRQLRENKGLLLREVAANLEIDPSLLSKIERGDKRPTRDKVVQMAQMFEADENELIVNYLSEKVIYQIKDEKLAVQALKVAEAKITNKKSND